MLGDIDILGNYNIPVKNNVIIIPSETGVEIGENLFLVRWADDRKLIVNGDLYIETMYNFLETQGYDKHRLIQCRKVRELERTVFGRMVEKDQNVREGYKITLSHEYDGINRVTLIPRTKSLEIIPVKTY